MALFIHKTKFTGKSLIYLKQIDSTNTYAKNLIAKTNPKNGTVILAEAQTNGRGQGTNIWLSEAQKNLTLSIIYFPEKLIATDHFILNMKIAIALTTTLKQYFYDDLILIKWPNDIYINDKKIAGILIENTICGQYIHKSIIGVGLNVNQTDFSDLTLATSMQLLQGKTYDLNEVLQTLLVEVEQWYLSIYNRSELQTIYEKKLYLRDKAHLFVHEQKTFNGTIIGVNEHGQLLIETTDGTKAFNQREIGFEMI